MFTAILLSGAFRSYTKALEPFLEQLPDTFHIFLCYPKDSEDQYLNDPFSLDSLIKNPRVKCIQVYEDPVFTTERPLTQRERNTFLQWYRIQKLFQEIDPEKYSVVIRMRPDIQFSCDTESFLAYFRQTFLDKTVYIPLGFDIFHSSFQHESYSSVNDQLAFGTYGAMMVYCSMFSFVLEKESQYECLVSEELLASHLQKESIGVQRIDIPYTLLLSKCFTISICGDSASGKSSLATLIQETLPFDKTLLFETDRYHKWERGAKEYRRYTHLHPEANHLEKLSTDAYKLRLGQDVFLVDYDHATGKFTEPQCVEAKHFTVFCGLHTLYLDSLRGLMDIKIYMDTDTRLKEFWKLQRDTQNRGATEETVRKTMVLRQPDFQTFVEPQKKNANLWIQFSSEEPADPASLQLRIGIHEELLTPSIEQKLTSFCLDSKRENSVLWLSCNRLVTSEALTKVAKEEEYSLCSLKDSYDGILQYLLILLTWRKSFRTI